MGKVLLIDGMENLLWALKAILEFPERTSSRVRRGSGQELGNIRLP